MCCSYLHLEIGCEFVYMVAKVYDRYMYHVYSIIFWISYHVHTIILGNDEWNIKEDTGKYMKNALRCAKRHLSA